jgi:hypothetical protein
LGVLVLALLFVGTFAFTRAPRTSAARFSKASIGIKPGAPSGPVFAPAWPSVFEIEGDAADNPAGGAEDWNKLNPGNIPSGTATTVTGTVAGSTAIVRTFVSDPAISTDIIFTGGGSKDFNDINQWGQVAKGTGPPKDDIAHGYAARYFNGGSSFIVFGADRQTNNGDANLGFWFFQNPVSTNNTGGFTGTHKNGDVLVISEFSGGGGTSTIRVLIWVGTPNSSDPTETPQDRCNDFDPDPDGDAFLENGTLCDVTGALPDIGTGITNSAPIQVSWQYKNTDSTQGGKAPAGTGVNCTTPPCTIPQPDFFEGVIDLSQIGLANECFASFLLETRSSSETSAVLKDLALGAFESCSGECGKSVDLGAVCEGAPVTYTFETRNTGGATLGQTFTDVNDNGTPCTGPNTPAGCANDDTTFYITGGLSEVPNAPATWTPTVCTTTTVGPAPTINIPAGKTYRCVLTINTPNVTVSTTFKDTFTVHTKTPFEGAVTDCVKTASVTVNPNPDANNASLTLCETVPGGGSATFNLANADSTVIGSQTGVAVTYYSDAALTTLIATPGAFSATNGTQVFAKVTNSTTSCFNSSTVTLNVNSSPAATAASAELCDDPNVAGQQATFNLTTLDDDVGGGAGLTVSWYSNAALTTPILSPSSFTTGSTTVYAKVTNNTTGCFNSAAVTLTVNPNPSVTISNFACDTDGSAILTANVTSGTGTLTYVWKRNGVDFAADAGHPEQITVTLTGTYTVDVTDSKGCVAAQASRVVGLCTSCTP